MHQTVNGTGQPLLLVHGIGSTSHTWRGLIPALAAGRRVIAIDLPGHGLSPAEADSGTFQGLVRSLAAYLEAEGLAGAAMVGSSLGGRLVLEMARRGLAGAVVAIDPGGFWSGWERTYLRTTLLSAVMLLRGIGPLRPALAHNPIARAALMSLLSARPWRLDPDLVRTELDSYAATATFAPLVNDLASGPRQIGPEAPSVRRVAIGWGRHDRLTWPLQARRAMAAFPAARLHWFEHSGHMPIWDEPAAVIDLIRETIA